MVYSDKMYVGFSDVGSSLEMTNTAILRAFENVCCMQGESVGDGISDSDGRWFLTAYRVRVFKRPAYNDRIIASTWSRCMKGVAASREFEIRSLDGQLCAASLSNWARMNIQTKKLERMSPEAFAKYESEPDRHNFDDPWIQKLRDPEASGIAREFYVDRNLIDPNGHMNNVCYLDLAVRTLPEEVYRLGEANAFDITYRKATAYAETVNCVYSEDASGRFVTVKSHDMSEIKAVARFEG